MKILLFLLCSLCSGLLMAQDCRDHVLMQKGAQLEYNFYWTGLNAGRAVSRLLYQVDQVTDSAGSTWSSITKRGFGVFDSTKHYERKVVLQCDGKYLLIPFDFYLTDTVYTRDIYNTLPPDMPDNYGYVVAFTPLKDAISYIVPLELDCTISLPEGKKQFVQRMKVGYRRVIPFSSKKYQEYPINIRCITLEGKEMVTTPAGTFACYKFCVEEERNNLPDEIKYWLYLNKEIGLIKYVQNNRSLELISIKK